MLHEIQEEEWENYLGGEAEAAASARIEAHLMNCPDCRLTVERMKQAERQLRQAVNKAKQRIALHDEQIYQGLRGVFLRLLAEESGAEASREQIIEPWLRALETALADLCGQRAAARVLHAAARNSPARSLEKIETGNWQPFLDNLTSITQVVCGELGAELIGEIGRFPFRLGNAEAGGVAALAFGSF